MSPTVSSTASAATPTLSAEPIDPLLNAVVVSVTDRLRVRSEPRVSDDSIMYEPVLPLGTELTVLDGPVSASGYVWYKVAPVAFVGLEGPGYGWVAVAGTDGEPWIAFPVTPRPTPAETAGPISFSAISAGRFHTCAITNAGGVKCWGYNDSGQLGNGTTIDSYVPGDVSGLGSGISAIATGGSHRCALSTGGGVKCWGSNEFGQLGDGSTTTSLVPVDVSGLASGVSAIAAGNGHTCALTTGGAVKCWGANQLGPGTTTPLDVTALGTGVRAIAAGGYRTCAVTVVGGVTCWGTSALDIPGDVPGLSNGVLAVAVGQSVSAVYPFACALTGAGGIKCWGYNGVGQLGNGTTTDSDTPVDVAGLAQGVAGVAAGYLHTCALMSTGGVKCWGRNFEGQLGDGTNIDRSTPVDVVGVTGGIVAVSAGVHDSCALSSTGGVKCWGRNEWGQLGDGTRGTRNRPVDVAFVIQQTLVLRASRPAGTVRSGHTITFTATVRPFRPPGTHPTVRFVVYRLVDGVWRLTAEHDVAADPADNDRAKFTWAFSEVGSQWYIRARVLGDGVNATSAWSVLFRYRVT